ncbi:MAG: PRC-barrel domain-containing protein [Planctomycetes bacterium]|nr:PRC-barrel domain-containing protein [Planctomycetota bacterium]
MTIRYQQAALAMMSASIIALVGAPALAQQPGQQGRDAQQQPQQKQKAPCLMEQGEVVGATITNGAERDELVELGHIADLVIDGRTGDVQYAIVSSGGTLGIGARQTAVAWSKLRCDDEGRFALAMTADQLAQQPAFDEKQLHALRGHVANAADSGERGVKEATGRAGEAGVAKAKVKTAKSPLVLASAIGEREVYASSDGLGDGATLVIEPRRGCAAFVAIAVGGVAGVGATHYVVPWRAVKLIDPSERDAGRIQLVKSRKELEAAPKLGSQAADLDDAKFRLRIYEFYEVERPDFEPKPKRADG